MMGEKVWRGGGRGVERGEGYGILDVSSWFLG